MKTSAFFFVLFSSVLFSLFSCKRSGIPDTQLGNWVASAPIGDPPRGNASCFVIGSDAYVGLGYNQSIGNTGRLKDFWRFNIDSGWAQVADFPGAPRSEAAAFPLGNYGYVGTGYDLVKVYNDFYQYDPVQDKWSITPGTSGNFSKRQGAAVRSLPDAGLAPLGQYHQYLRHF